MMPDILAGMHRQAIFRTRYRSTDVPGNKDVREFRPRNTRKSLKKDPLNCYLLTRVTRRLRQRRKNYIDFIA